MIGPDQIRSLIGLPAGARVVAAMSGGVDSSVAAALLVEAGYDTVGITLQLYDHGEMLAKKGACCAGQDIYDARQVADRIGIPHYVLDYENRFRQSVIDAFADAYLQGETPIPCIRCNQRVKFQDLLGTARELGAAAMVTGHYVQRLIGSSGGAELHRAADLSRDQSYFLFATTKPQLDFLRFPLGGLPKSETRALAERLALPVAAKPDSQDICFVPTGDYASTVAKLRPGAIEPGDIVHCDGRVLGRHQGIIRFTIGQRRGIGIAESQADGEPLYVIKLDPARQQVIVGPKAALAVTHLDLVETNWLGGLSDASGDLVVKVRSTTAPVPADLQRDATGEGARIAFAAPQFGVAPGQACVIYRGERVLGGGWIKRTHNAHLPLAAPALLTRKIA